MSNTISITVLCGTVIFCNAAMGEDVCTGAEQRFQKAVEVYVEKGANAFWEEVLRNGPLEGDKRSMSQVQALGQVEDFFGQIQSASVISKKALGPKACYLVGVLEFAKGPAFAVATYYKGKQGVGATSMLFRTEPEAVIPRELLIERANK